MTMTSDNANRTTVNLSEPKAFNIPDEFTVDEE
jgi:hypothetical protein